MMRQLFGNAMLAIMLFMNSILIQAQSEDININKESSSTRATTDKDASLRPPGDVAPQKAKTDVVDVGVALSLNDDDIREMELETARKLDYNVARQAVILNNYPQEKRDTLEYYLAYQKMAADYSYTKGSPVWEDLAEKLTDRIIWPQVPSDAAVEAYDKEMIRIRKDAEERAERQRRIQKEAEDRALQLEAIQLQNEQVFKTEEVIRQQGKQIDLLKAQIRNQENLERFVRYGY